MIIVVIIIIVIRIRIIAIIIIIVVIIEIRIEILQGAFLSMGSIHLIQVTGSDIEGTDYNNNIDKYCILMSSPWREYCNPHLSNAYQASPYEPHSCIDSWMEQENAIRATTLIKAFGKPTLTSALDKVDALGIKFEDLLKLYLESTTTEAFYTLLKEREASIASVYGRSSRKRWGTPARCALS